MDVMTIFHIVMLIFGVYMAGAALKMKKTGEISPVILAAEEIAKCKDKQAFITFMYWKEAVFGVVVIFAGALGLINDLIVSLRAFNIAELAVFLAAFVWFQMELKKARIRFW